MIFATLALGIALSLVGICIETVKRESKSGCEPLHSAGSLDSVLEESVEIALSVAQNFFYKQEHVFHE